MNQALEVQHDHLLARNKLLMESLMECVEALKSIENDDKTIPATIWEMRNAAIRKAESL